MRSIARLLGAVLAAAALPSGAQGDALKQFVERVSTLSAGFEQVQMDEEGKVLQVSTGTVAIERAASSAETGKFSWRYRTPYEQLLLCDGQQIWLYDPDLAQVTVRPAKQALAGTPAELLAQRGTLDAQFERTVMGEEGGVTHMKLLPKSADGEFRQIDLWFKDGVPSRMRFRDPLGGTSEVKFTETSRNMMLDPKLFRFEVPKGVEVVRAQDAPR